MTQKVWRRGAFLTLGAAALVAGCGTVQQFDPAPEHLKSLEGNTIIPAPVTQLPAPPAPVAKPVQETYTLVVTDVPVREVLFALARDAAINVDIAGNIEGNVTLNAVNQTLPQILERISRQVSLRHNIENGTLVVTPDAPYWQNYRVDYVNLARGSEGEVTVATQVASTGGSVDEDSEGGGGSGVTAPTRTSREPRSRASPTTVTGMCSAAICASSSRVRPPAAMRQQAPIRSLSTRWLASSACLATACSSRRCRPSSIR